VAAIPIADGLPTLIQVPAVTIPESTASPAPVIVAPIPGPNTPSPVLKQVPAVTIPAKEADPTSAVPRVIPIPVAS